MKKINVLVAGSTGFIGLQLIKLLVKHFICKDLNIYDGNSTKFLNLATYDQELKIKRFLKLLNLKKNYLKKWM